MIVAFTGPSALTRSEELRVVARIEDVAATFDTWRSGCAFGVDSIAARQAILSDVLGLELYVPAAPHNEALVMELADRARVIPCPRRATDADSYRMRNRMMVDEADHLIAFVKSAVYYRSGEWMTINLARKRRVPVELNVI